MGAYIFEQQINNFRVYLHGLGMVGPLQNRALKPLEELLSRQEYSSIPIPKIIQNEDMAIGAYQRGEFCVGQNAIYPGGWDTESRIMLDSGRGKALSYLIEHWGELIPEEELATKTTWTEVKNGMPQMLAILQPGLKHTEIVKPDGYVLRLVLEPKLGQDDVDAILAEYDESVKPLLGHELRAEAMSYLSNLLGGIVGDISQVPQPRYEYERFGDVYVCKRRIFIGGLGNTIQKESSGRPGKALAFLLKNQGGSFTTADIGVQIGWSKGWNWESALRGQLLQLEGLLASRSESVRIAPQPNDSWKLTINS